MEEIFVAKSYIGLPFIGEPYIKNKKKYIKVQLKSGKEKEIRIYNSSEYEKMYPAPAPKWKPQRELLGFGEDGFILIFNNKPEFETFYEKGPFRYHRVFGWYLPGNEIVPALLPGIVPKVLSWEIVGGENGELIAEDKLIKVFNKFVRSI